MNPIESAYTPAQIRSRLGISTWVLERHSGLNPESLGMIADAGIATIEISDERQRFQEEDPSSMQKIVAACRELGLSVTSFHSRSIDYHGLGLDAEIERSKRMIDHLLDIGGSVWGTHVKIVHAETRLGYEALARYYEGQDVKLVIENGGIQPIRACIDWIDAIGHPQIGLLLDIGHECDDGGVNVMTKPGEPTRILPTIGKRLHHVHLHDSDGSAGHYPPFEGKIQWAEVFSGLKHIGYEGALLFEPRPVPDFAESIRKVGAAPEAMAEWMASV